MSQFQLFQFQRPNRRPLQFAYRQSYLRQHASYLAVNPLVYLDLQRRRRPSCVLQAHLVALHASFRQVHSLAQLRHRRLARRPPHFHLISLWYLRTWVREPLCEVPVVGQQYQPRAVRIQSSHAEQPLRYMWHKFRVRRMIRLRPRRAQYPSRLIQYQVN